MDSNKLGHHISEQFNKELEDIRNKVLIMGGLLEQQIDLAVQAFTTGNIEIAEVVIKQDNQVDEMEMAIDQECTEILARRQPTAFDLRLLMSVIKIVHELERVGDKAKRVSEMAIQLGGGNGKVTYYEIEHMAECGSRGSVHGVPLLVRHLVDHSIPCEASIIDKNVDLRSINAPDVA